MDWDLMRTSEFRWEFFTNRIRSWEYLASEAPENSGVPVFFQPTGGPTLCWLIIVINIPFMGLSSRSCRCRWTYSQEKNMKVFTNSEVVSWTKTHDIPMVSGVKPPINFIYVDVHQGLCAIAESWLLFPPKKQQLWSLQRQAGSGMAKSWFLVGWR